MAWKRLRTDGGVSEDSKMLSFPAEVNRRIESVRRAVAIARGRSEACQVMLDCLARSCLGPGVDERDSLQERAEAMVGEVIDSLHVARVLDVKRRQAYIANPEDAVIAAEQEATYAEDRAGEAVENAKQKKRILEDAKAASNDAAAALNEAEAALSDANRCYAEKADGHFSCVGSYEQHFIPLRDGLYSNSTEANSHSTALQPMFRKFEYEKSLTKCFPFAARRHPLERGPFDRTAMEEAEKRFMDKRNASSAEVEAIERVVAQAKQQAADANVKAKLAQEHLAAAGLAYGRALADEKRATEASDDARQTVDELKGGPEEVARNLKDAEQKLLDFEEGPLKSFQWLKWRVIVVEGRGRSGK
eukprot:TRINITY_DN29048_c0_g1_i1.p1 TRINITY_DN29048_c0_g1~~TRINITY_DN29048_c0_g1_i1.p1  ORF type:complete len:418 (-),score=87.17 TRINITY_DN29048_c0_g1_i1:313-1395(-)